MKIIIEGCDGTGKTTLAKKIAEKYGLDIVHITNKDPNDFEFYFQSLRKTNVVYDRNVIGEMIYPKIFNRKGNIDGDDLRYLIEKARKNNVIILVLTCRLKTIKDRLIERGGEHSEILNNLFEIDKMFKHYAAMYDIPIINTAEINFEEICEKYLGGN